MEKPSEHVYLPEDAVFEILLRLPVKTLLRFKCVSKHWYVLIESPDFIKQHFVHDSNQDHLLIRHYNPDKKHAHALFLGDSLSEYVDFERLHEMPHGVSYFVGPLNGIFCVVSFSGHMAFLNPATRQYMPLPLVHQPHVNLRTMADFMGFGLDPLSGDYKLVLIEYFWDNETNFPRYPGLVSVYNSGSNSWRQFEDVNLVNSCCRALSSQCNTYWNGVYYWLTEYDEIDIHILAFDMSGETFYEVQVPDCITAAKELQLSMYCDSIALVSYDFDPDNPDKCIDVWVMTKEGCWIKSLRIGPFQGIAWPVGFWKNNELLLQTKNKILALYGMNTKKLRASQLRVRRYTNSIFPYKESLFSIDVKGGKWKQWDTSSDYIKNLFD